MKNNHLIRLLELSLATLFISTSGALGKFIDMPSPILVWWRSAIAIIFIFLFCRFKNVSLKIKSKKHLPTFILSAFFMGAHWITYFYALKLSNVALGMLSLFTFPVITALLEPLFIKSKLDYMHIILGLMVLLGIYILAPEFNIESSQVQGILLGILSAICYALRTLIIKQHVSNYNASMLMFYQMVLCVLMQGLMKMLCRGLDVENCAAILRQVQQCWRMLPAWRSPMAALLW